MANMIMASTKPIVPQVPSCSLTNNRPKIQIPLVKLPKIPKPDQVLSLNALKNLSFFAATSLTFAPPSFAAEIEKAALFDFNLTLPIIMVEFLILMVALDKLYFSPLGKFMDERDAAIKEKLGSVKDTSEEVKQLEEQAAAIMRAARAEISAALSKMKKETQLEVEQKLAEGRKKVEAELQEALAALEQQKEDTIKALDSQIAALSQEIVKKLFRGFSEPLSRAVTAKKDCRSLLIFPWLWQFQIMQEAPLQLNFLLGHQCCTWNYATCSYAAPMASGLICGDGIWTITFRDPLYFQGQMK